MNDWLPIVPPLGCVFGAICLWAGLRAARRKRLVNDLPTSKTTGVFIGFVEVKGTAESPQPLTSFLAEQPCIYYEWSVQEHWSRTVTETYTDSKGNRRTRTRRESGWTTVASGTESQPFYLRDDSGAIRVLPKGAKIEPVQIFSETCDPGDALYYAKGPAAAVAHSDYRRSFTENAIVLHTPLYVIGQARERKDVVAAEIAASEQAPMFLISTRSEEQISASFGWGKWLCALFGAILSVGGFFIAQQIRNVQPNLPVLATVLASYVAIAGLCWVWMVFNSLVDLRQRVRQAWAQVDVQLKRRHDLIPNLVRAIQGLRDYERLLQTELAQLRAQSAATPPGQPGPDYHAMTKVLVAVTERYPELCAQPSFLNLQKELVETEQRIALARGYFNEIATFFNTRLEILPDRFVASLARMKPQSLMAANAFERAPIDVDLAPAKTNAV